MVYDLLSPGGQHLVVNRDSIQITENKKLCKVYGWAGAEENYENVAVLYSHLTSLLEEGTIKVSKRLPFLHLMCLTPVRVAKQSGGGPLRVSGYYECFRKVGEESSIRGQTCRAAT